MAGKDRHAERPHAARVLLASLSGPNNSKSQINVQFLCIQPHF